MSFDYAHAQNFFIGFSRSEYTGIGSPQEHENCRALSGRRSP